MWLKSLIKRLIVNAYGSPRGDFGMISGIGGGGDDDVGDTDDDGCNDDD